MNRHPLNRLTRTGCLLLAAVLLPAALVAAADDAAAVRVTVMEDAAARIVLRLDVADFRLQNVTIAGRPYAGVSLGGESLLHEKGAPALPHVCRSVIIAERGQVSARVLDARFEDIEAIDVLPSKGHFTRDIRPQDVPWTFSAVYVRDAFYPGELVRLADPHVLRDVRGVTVEMLPFQYNPVSHTLRVYRELTIEIAWTADGGVNTLDPGARRAADPSFSQLYRGRYLNAETSPFYPVLDEAGGMLIIVYDAWAAQVQPLAAHKTSRGIPTAIKPVSTIPGGNTASAIKAYIQQQYNAGNLAFVLLVGDAAQVATPHASGGAADPTYALLAGADHYPDIFVGRFSAETSAQVDTQVLRTIEYEQLPATQTAWFKRGTGIGSAEGPGDDGEYDYQHIDNIRTKLLNYGYTLVDRIYDPGATAAQVSAALNAGRGIVNYCGHGSTTSWSTTGFSNGHVAALVNDNMLPFIVSVACVNGQFEGTTCFAEAWLRATHLGEPTGAIGMYASSVNQYWNPPMAAQDETVDLLVQERYFSFGALCFAGSCRMMDEYGGAGVEMYDTWHVFGDPSLRVYNVPEMPGDIDGDGDCDTVDCELFVNVMVGGIVNPLHRARADLNGDGAADGDDIPLFVHMLL